MSRISNLLKIAIAAIDPPNANEPVSPIKTLAGYALKTKNPSNAPTVAKEKITSSFCGKPYHARTANAPKAIAAVPVNSPSNPSVKLTALEDPTSINITSKARSEEHTSELQS